jgi:hypothetical protein
MRALVLGLLMAIMVFSTAVIAASLSTGVGRIAGGSADVKHAKVKVLEVRDELTGINLKTVYVTLLVDFTGTYRVTVTVSNDLGSASGSWTGTLTAGQEQRIAVTLSQALKEGNAGFTHRVEVTLL